MSTYVMVACWPLKMSPARKAVLISLADNANDDGHCWPSLATICDRTCLGRTAVIDAIRWLEGQALLVADRRNGRHSKYVVTPPGYVPPGMKEPVRQPDRSDRRTGSANGSPPSGRRTGPVRQTDSNHHEPSRTITTTTHAFELDWTAAGLMSFGDGEKTVVVGMLEGLSPETQQEVLDELAGFIEDKAVKTAPSGLLATLATRAREGRFVLNRGRRIRDTRKARQQPKKGGTWRATSESRYDNEVNYARQQYQYGVIDGAERDRLIADAAAKHRVMEGISAGGHHMESTEIRQ